MCIRDSTDSSKMAEVIGVSDAQLRFVTNSQDVYKRQDCAWRNCNKKSIFFIFPDDGGESVKLGNTFDLCHLWRNVYASYGD